jgi:predicted lipoprotein with Yx(FWY)xxD motif
MRQIKGTPIIRLAVASIAAAGVLGLAACGSDNSDEGDATTSSSATETVSTQSIDGTGDVLVDSGGAALYSPEQESSGKIVCTGECESIWMPLTSSGKPTASSDLEGDLGTVERPDGSEQVTFDGAPLYTFTEESAGQVTGDGLADSFSGDKFTWHVMTPSGAASGSTSTTADQSSGGYDY